MINILVTTCGGAAGINALRLLGNRNVFLYSTDIDINASGKLFSHDFRLISPVSNFEQYSKDLKKMIEDWKIDWVVPILPEELEVIESVVNQTKSKILISPLETLSICCDKVKFYTWAQKNTPEFCAEWATLNKWGDIVDIGYNLFLKPSRGRGSKGCKKIGLADLSEFKDRLIDCGKQKEWIVMEVLPGEEYTVDCYVRKDGEIKFIVPRQRIQTLGGVCIKGKTEKNDILINNTKLILEKLNFWGPVCVQWKKDALGNFKLLEINPRLSGGCMITAVAGADATRCFIQEIQGTNDKVDWDETVVLGYNDYRVDWSK